MKFFLLALLALYRWCVSPFTGGCCRFFPSCSEYMREAIEHYGPWKGLWKGCRRLLKCHPWHPGGYDPP